MPLVHLMEGHGPSDSPEVTLLQKVKEGDIPLDRDYT